MNYLLSTLKEALILLLKFDKEVYQIIALSLFVSINATIIASFIGIPTGFMLSIKKFFLKKVIIKIIYTGMSFPPVVIGLVVGLFLSRKGPLGHLELMFTPVAMIIAQTILLIPITTGIVYNNTKLHVFEILEATKTLGCTRKQSFLVLLKELKVVISISIITGFGRAISEVGAVMIVGGNIKGSTRVMTTFIAMNNSMGDYDKSLAMGLILIIISFIINSFIYTYTMEGSWK